MGRNEGIKRLSIQHAALDLFSRKGYRNVTINEIAAKSNFSKKTIYNYFPSKLALFASLFEDYLKQLNDAVARTISKNDDINITIRNIFTLIFNYSYENQEFMRLFWIINTDELSGEIPPEVLQHIQLWNKSVFDQVSEAYKDKLTGLFARYPERLIVHLLSALNKGIFVHFAKEKQMNIGDLEQVKESLLELCLELINLGMDDCLTNKDNKNYSPDSNKSLS